MSYYNYDNFEKHKKSDTVKWVIVFLLVFILIGAVAGLSVWMVRITRPEKPVEGVENQETTWHFMGSEEIKEGIFLAPKEFSLKDQIGKPLKIMVDDKSLVLSYVHAGIDDSNEIIDHWVSGATFADSTYFVLLSPDPENAGQACISAENGKTMFFDLGTEKWCFSFFESTDQAYIFAPIGFDLKDQIGKDLTVTLGEKSVALSYGDKFEWENNTFFDTNYWIDFQIGVGAVEIVEGMDGFVSSVFDTTENYVGRTLLLFEKETVMTITLPQSAAKAEKNDTAKTEKGISEMEMSLSVSRFAAASTSSYTSLGVEVADSDLAFMDNGFEVFSDLNVAVKNDINNSVLTTALVCRPAGGGSLPFVTPILVLPRVNVFSELGNYILSDIVVKVNGTVKDTFYPTLYSSAISCYSFNSLSDTVEVTYTLEKVDQPVPLPDDPVKEGHTFVGWYYDSAFTRPYDYAPITADTQLYAKFVANEYTVTFDSAGGNAIANQTVTYQNTVTIPTPIKTGYTFKGWFLADGTKYTNQPVTANLTLTARWEIIMCTVTFYVDNEVYDTKTVEYGTYILKIIDSAVSEMNLNVTAVRFANGSVDGAELAEMTVVGDKVELIAEKLTDTDKIVATVKEKKWAIIGSVAGVVALIAIIVAIVGGTRKRR